MLKISFKYAITLGLWWALGSATLLYAQTHPYLLLQAEQVSEIRKSLGKVPLFDTSLTQAIQEVDQAMGEGIQVPVPKDMAGGYTHEQHKKNFFILQKAGVIFQLTQEEKYAQYIRETLLAYAKLYPTLDIHPTKRSYATGKLFWQCLNDANWLVYVSQAYDCIYDWLPVGERERLEKDLFRPFADFLSIENPQFFDRIHNHSTWGNAAVGMIGLVMGDEELIQRALYGLSHGALSSEAYDNDGGLIKDPTQKESGFLAQIDHAFSPDGYYTEGPYYQRYAIFPFMVFAQALAVNRPDLQIFSYRDSLLIRSVFALLNQTNTAGEFFPINDAQKGMSFLSRELILAVDLSYYFGNQNPQLLGIAGEQGQVSLDEAGFLVAKHVAQGKSQAFTRESQELRDGAAGDQGALGILRGGRSKEEMTLVMKYTAQGLGHGHYDKLSFSYYDQAEEVIQDYGAARWVNIDQKDGGRYLKENKTWAKQSIAHNTLVINRTSHFGGVYKTANQHHSEPYLFAQLDSSLQVASAKDHHAYPGLTMHRSMFLLQDSVFSSPLLIDLFRLSLTPNAEESLGTMSLDLPYYFQGHLMNSSFDYELTANGPQAMGTDHGYQHLYQEAVGHSDSSTAWFNWFNGKRFYTLYGSVQSEDSLIFARIGANDPHFNLRRDPALIFRKNTAAPTLFLTAIESHGNYSPVTEIPSNPFGSLQSLDCLHSSAAYTVIRVTHQSGKTWTICLANESTDISAQHTLSLNSTTLQWVGPLQLITHPN